MATAKKKISSKKKVTSNKKTTTKKSPAANRKKKAADNRSALLAKLKQDLAATRVALKAANKGAREEIKLARSVAKAEVAVLKDQLNVALKQEKALRTMAENKAKILWAAGQRW
ncbi:MAG: hypothetical protein ACC635_05710, partial [Acidiferrobacterales bacterium]